MTLSSSGSRSRAVSGAALREAIERVAALDADRVAIVGAGVAITYGEIAAAIADPPAPSAARGLMPVAGPGDAVAIVRAATSGESVLLHDARATPWEVERIGAVWSDPRTASDEPALGLCTSGTNALPKLVELPWPECLANAASFGAAVGYDADDVIWVTGALSHLYGLGAGMLAGLLAGARIVVVGGALGPGELIEVLAGYGVSVLLAVPFVLRRYVAELERAPDTVAQLPLRATVAAGEPVEPELVRRWRAASGSTLHAHYGLTEGGHLTFADGAPESGVGRALRDVEIEVDARGELRARRQPPAQPYRILGGSGDPGGWVSTGDLGHIDRAGNVHITGRIGDRVNVAGKKVDPAEVEDALRCCATVEDCAVSAVPGASGEAELVAFVQVSGELDERGLRRELGGLLSPYKLPRRFVAVPEIARSPNGKVQRGAMVAALGELSRQTNQQGEERTCKSVRK